jgi:hypothetical protein
VSLPATDRFFPHCGDACVTCARQPATETFSPARAARLSATYPPDHRSDSTEFFSEMIRRGIPLPGVIVLRDEGGGAEKLIDGAHRMKAISQAGVTVRARVCWLPSVHPRPDAIAA